MDDLKRRWARLEPHTVPVGPDDDRPRPAVLLFHGCGGLRPHLPEYAAAASARGHRAFIVDSFGARGWSRAVSLALVCPGVIFRGRERAGDVLAALWGVSQRPDVDAGRVTLAGWSHGGWGIMQLMAAPLERPGELGLADPMAADLSGVKANFLAYPYVGPGSRARTQPWRRCPKTLAVIARRDHLTTVRNAERVHEMVRGCGVEMETWVADGSHAFDEPSNAGPMAYDPALAEESISRFSRFLEQAVGPA